MRRYRIAVIPGDSVGKEVIPASLEVLEAVARRESAVIARSHRASKDARLSTGYGDEVIQRPQSARSTVETRLKC